VKPLLEVKSLRTSFFTDAGEVRAVDGVSFSVAPGKLLGIVGESGSGKTASVLSIMRLLPESARIVGGEVTFEDQDLLKLSEPEMRHIRGARIAMIFQEPMTSLNPVFTIGSQIGEAVRLHQHTNRAETRNRTIEALRMVGIADPERRIDDYPHQLSGGMRQRVMIAMALSCNPQLLIADEPTTALDVTIQAQILDLLERERKRRGMALILITHDLGVVASVTDRVIVMYAGRVVESGSTQDIFSDPRHPYTLGLMNSMPRLDSPLDVRPATIPGSPPTGYREVSGCPFSPRCTWVRPACRTEYPPLERVAGAADTHQAACLIDVRTEDPSV
jgi:oligopeptide/dipeptide ABC transporter ATP-binding protein